MNGAAEQGSSIDSLDPNDAPDPSTSLDSLQVGDPLDAVSEEFSHPPGSKGSAGGQQGQELKPPQGIPRGIGMEGGQSALMARIQGLEEIQHFLPPAFAEEDSIGAHPQGLPEEVSNGDFAAPVGVRGTCQETNEMRMSGPDLGGVLECDDPLMIRNEAQEIGEQGRLAGSGASAQEKGFSRLNRAHQEFERSRIRLPTESGLAPTALRGARDREPPEREMNSARGQGRKGDMGPVRTEKHPIDKGVFGIPGAADGRELVENHPLEFGFIREARPFTDLI